MSVVYELEVTFNYIMVAAEGNHIFEPVYINSVCFELSINTWIVAEITAARGSSINTKSFPHAPKKPLT